MTDIKLGKISSKSQSGCKWSASISVLILGLVNTSAFAQSNEPEAQTSTEDIIVTAQKRDARLLDTPISIGVMSGGNLEQSSARSAADVISQIGGVAVNETQPGQSVIIVRGVPAGGVGTSTAAFYLDEVPFTFIGIADAPQANAYDLERIEVLRGPQGTLYGANALSGAIRVITRDADFNDTEFKGRLSASNTKQGSGNFSGDLAANLPLIEGKMAIRGVVSYSDLSGFITSRRTGQQHINSSKEENYRFKLGYQATEDLLIKLGFSRSNIKNASVNYAYVDLTTPFAPQNNHRSYNTYNLIGEYRFDNFSVLSSTSYLTFKSNEMSDIFLTGTSFLPTTLTRDMRSFAQEVRVVSNLEGPWKLSAGAIYKNTVEKATQIATAAFPFPFSSRYESNSYAVFGDVTRSFADGRIELTGGLRYFHDDLQNKLISGFRNGVGDAINFPSVFKKLTGRAVLTFKPVPDQLFYASASTGFRSGFNSGFSARQAGLIFPPLGPDSLITYEAGNKGKLMDGALVYDAAVYFMDWKNIQQFLVVPQGFSVGVNAGKASGFGLEATLGYTIARPLTIRGSIGWSGLKFDENVLQRGIVLFARGSRVNLSPEWSGSVGADYKMTDAFGDLDFVTSMTYAFRSRTISSFLNGTVFSRSFSDAPRDLKASVGVEQENWALRFYGDNIFDSRAAVSPSSSTFGNTALRSRPRTIGIQAEFKF